MVTRLLDKRESSRLGSMTGASEVKAHKWFKGLNWEHLYLRKIVPPFVPLLTAEGDTSHFSRYSESMTQAQEPAPQEQLFFAEF